MMTCVIKSRRQGLILVLLLAMLFQTACGLKLVEQQAPETSPASSVASTELPSTQMTTPATTPVPTTIPTIQTVLPSAAASESTETTESKGVLYLEPEGAARINQEPPVPLNLPSENPIRGIAGHLVERFFKTLSTNPVYYHFVMHPKKTSEDHSPKEILIALNDRQGYMRINTLKSAWVLLILDDTHFYKVDLLANTAQLLTPKERQSSDLSMYAFEQLEANAAHFIATGVGDAIFFGRQVRFEEFTADGLEYIRYYFFGDVLLGHRRFVDGVVEETVEIKEVSNKLYPELFTLPEEARILSPKVVVADPNVQQTDLSQASNTEP